MFTFRTCNMGELANAASRALFHQLSLVFGVESLFLLQ
jgi:hypothetical protein